MSKIIGAVFDMDGLMFDTERLVYENWKNKMTSLGYEYNLDIFKNTVGKRKKEVELYYKSLYGEEFPYWNISDECRQRYIERVGREGVPVKKGLYEILDYLKNRGIKIALATSTSRQTSELNLRSAKIEGYFDVLVCGEDVINGKPHPEVFLKAAERLGAHSEQCAAFEDSLNGICSAHAAGMTTFMVPDLLQPTEEILPMISFLCADLLKAMSELSKYNP